MNAGYKSLLKIKSKLNKAKSALDKISSAKCEFVSAAMNIYKTDKTILTKALNYPVTNAWMKLIEIYKIFNIQDYVPHNPVYFDNASLPGLWILASLWYFKELEWYASSLVDGEYLGDNYKIYENNKSKFYMGNLIFEGNEIFIDGDVCKIENIEVWSRSIPPLDLYTSDLGMSGEAGGYNNQEKTHLKPHIGQSLAMLKMLKTGGVGVLKQYTYFEHLTISLLYLLSMCFDKFHIYKPVTSHATNSESYVICIGAKSFEERELAINLFTLKLANFNYESMVKYPQSFLNSLPIDHYHNQIVALKRYVEYSHSNTKFADIQKNEMLIQNKINFVKTFYE